MNIGFIGTGNMGFPMAKNLLQQGFSLKIFNRTYQKAEPLAAWGGLVVNDPAEAAADADVVISMLSDDAAVSAISRQVVNVMKAGAAHLSMSTIAPATAVELHQLHHTRSVHYIAAPVLGRPPAAEARQLFILLSGEATAKEKVSALIETLGQKTFDLGTDVSAANTVKIMMNFMVFTTVELLSEVMLVAEKTGIDKTMLLDTITSSVFGAPAFKNYGGLILKEQDNPNGFATRLASKDLRLLQEAAGKVQLSLPLASLIQDHFKGIINEGAGEKDISLLINHLRKHLVK